MKKRFAILMTLIMVFALAIPAFAATTTYTVTINQDNTTHNYEIYQIFTGDITDAKDEDGNVIAGQKAITNVEWGSGINADGIEYFNDLYGSAQGTANTLKTTEDAAKFAEIIGTDYLGTLQNITYKEGVGYQKTSLVAGYYLIMDKANSLDDSTEGYTSYILKLVEDVTVEPKDGETTIEKKVDDKNDSTGAEDEIIWHDSADHDINDLINFSIVTTIAEDYVAYEDEYYYAIHDKEGAGLDFQADTVEIYVCNNFTADQLEDVDYVKDNGVKVVTGYNVDTAPADGDTFDIVFENLKNISSVTAGSKIVVYYQSKLNENAVIGNLGNLNEVYGEFSNNPNDEGHGKTEKDTVIVFTYKVTVDKVTIESTNDDGSKVYAPLAGADFTLEKFVAAEDGTDEYNDIKGNWVVIDKVEDVDLTTTTSFAFEGIDDGYYRLTESVTPTGYNTIDPVEFTVTADHDILWTSQLQTEVLNTLEAEALGLDTESNIEQGFLTFESDVKTGNMNAKVLNVSGIVLPETGGIGTTIFYVVGTLLVVGAAILLITKKRMNSKV